jgi:hypothetical protein
MNEEIIPLNETNYWKQLMREWDNREIQVQELNKLIEKKKEHLEFTDWVIKTTQNYEEHLRKHFDLLPTDIILDVPQQFGCHFMRDGVKMSAINTIFNKKAKHLKYSSWEEI